VAATLFWGGWLRPFRNVAWLEYLLNYALPVAILAGAGVMCFPIARRLKAKWQQIFLMAVGLILMLLSLPFLVQVINQAIIGLFWFLLKVALIICAMIWFRGTWPRLR
jgi:NADH-quinone oxidoreductase subunit H